MKNGELTDHVLLSGFLDLDGIGERPCAEHH